MSSSRLAFDVGVFNWGPGQAGKALAVNDRAKALNAKAKNVGVKAKA